MQSRTSDRADKRHVDSESPEWKVISQLILEPANNPGGPRPELGFVLRTFVDGRAEVRGPGGFFARACLARRVEFEQAVWRQGFRDLSTSRIISSFRSTSLSRLCTARKAGLSST
jgi:hypothetical protein